VTTDGVPPELAARAGRLLRAPGIDVVAERLGLHPFDVARILAIGDGLPPELAFDGSAVARIRAAGGLQDWWSEQPPEVDADALGAGRELLRSLLARMLKKGLVGASVTRADNLFRGLPVAQERALRRSVNVAIREGCLTSLMAPIGLVVSVAEARVDEVRAFVAQGDGLLAVLAELD
jgi:hypothetical protein